MPPRGLRLQLVVQQVVARGRGGSGSETALFLSLSLSALQAVLCLLMRFGLPSYHAQIGLPSSLPAAYRTPPPPRSPRPRLSGLRRHAAVLRRRAERTSSSSRPSCPDWLRRRPWSSVQASDFPRIPLLTACRCSFSILLGICYAPFQRHGLLRRGTLRANGASRACAAPAADRPSVRVAQGPRQGARAAVLRYAARHSAALEQPARGALASSERLGRLGAVRCSRACARTLCRAAAAWRRRGFSMVAGASSSLLLYRPDCERALSQFAQLKHDELARAVGRLPSHGPWPVRPAPCCSDFSAPRG